MRNAGETGDIGQRICLKFAPRYRGAFFATKNPAYWICKNKKKGVKNADNIRLKKKNLSTPDGGISRKEPALTDGETEKSVTQSGFGALTGTEKMLFP